MAIVWRALMLFAGYAAEPDKYMLGQDEYQRMLRRMAATLLPRIEYSAPLMKLPQAPLRTGYITFAGGLDTGETPAIRHLAGEVQDLHQCTRGGGTWGLRRYHPKGYEGFDNRPAPHLAVYSTQAKLNRE